MGTCFCGLETYESESKCILHCKKTKTNGWFELSKNKKNWHTTKVNLFWSTIRKFIKDDIIHGSGIPDFTIDFNKIKFPIFQKLPETLEEYQDTLESNNFLNVETSHTFPVPVKFDHCEFLGEVFFVGENFDSKLDFDNCIFNDSVSFERVSIKQETSIKNCNFKEQCTFSNSHFDDITIEETNFIKNIFVEKNSEINVFKLITNSFEKFEIYNSNLNAFKCFDLKNNHEIIFDHARIKKFLLADFAIRSKLSMDNITCEELTIADGTVNHISINNLVDLNKISFVNINTNKMHIFSLDYNDSFEITSFLSSEIEELYILNMQIKEKSNFQIENILFNAICFQNVIISEKANCVISNTSISHYFSLNNSILSNTIFNHIELEKSTIKIVDSQVENSKFFNVNWGKTDLSHLDHETCNQMKNSYDKRGNIIEANKFYALEMEAYRSKIKKDGHWKDKLIFNFHNMISNHSQNWALPIYWLFVIGFIFAALEGFVKNHQLKIEFVFLSIIFFVTILIWLSFIISDIEMNLKRSKHPWLAYRPKVLLLMSAFLLYGYGTTQYFDFNSFAEIINPIAGIGSNHKQTPIISLTCKIIILYIGYQFIVAVRKDTKRK